MSKSKEIPPYNTKLDSIGLEDFDDPAINFRPTQVELGDVIQEGDLGSEFSYDLEDAYSHLPKISDDAYDALTEEQKMKRYEFFERQMQKMRDRNIHEGYTPNPDGGYWIPNSSKSPSKKKNMSIQDAMKPE